LFGVPLTHVKGGGGREVLIAATLRVLDREGAEGVNLRAVGKEASVSAPALYWHFEDKEALVGAVVLEIGAQFVDRVRRAAAAAPKGEGLLAVGDTLIEFVIEYPHRFQLLFRRPPRNAMKPLKRTPPPHTSFGILVQVVEQGMVEGTLRREDPASVALTIAAIAQGLVVLLERNRFTDREEFAEFARVSFRRLLQGLAV
jgi:AcrR family transcriptional regulator